MVGAAVGFGGKLIRTVSFFGCTLPVSFFGGGIAPVGNAGIEGVGGGVAGFGLDGGTSAINVVAQDKQGGEAVKFYSKSTKQNYFTKRTAHLDF